MNSHLFIVQIIKCFLNKQIPFDSISSLVERPTYTKQAERNQIRLPFSEQFILLVRNMRSECYLDMTGRAPQVLLQRTSKS